MDRRISRYELKYLIPREMEAEVVRRLEPYCELDPHSQGVEKGYYFVNSLYFDTPHNLFYENRMADAPERFTMRVRAYGEIPAAPFFLEVKERTGDYVRKYRGRTLEADWASLLRGTKRGDADLDIFTRLAVNHRIEPKIMTRYRRKAYSSFVDEYVRFTFDRDLSFYTKSSLDLKVDEDCRVPYDRDPWFPPGAELVLEIKTLPTIPRWVLSLIRDLQLNRASFSKYASSYTELQQRGLTRTPFSTLIF